MKNKYSHQEIQDFFTKNNCKLLTISYLNSKQKLKYVCQCGNVSNIRFDHFRNGVRCKQCGINKLKKSKMNYSQVKDLFISQKCVLLSTKYINSRTLLEYICQCGNKSKIALAHFKRGRRCKKCGHIKRGLKKRHSYEYVNKIFTDCGAILLDKEYLGTHKLMNYICVCGNISKISLNAFKRGERCKNCWRHRMTKENHPLWIKDREKYYQDKLFKVKSSIVRMAIKYTKQDIIFQNKFYDILGYSVDDFKEHIMSHPNWSNCQGKKWHIDHILPIQAFIDRGIKDIKTINSLDNLQPLVERDNLTKSDSYNQLDFERFLIQKAFAA